MHTKILYLSEKIIVCVRNDGYGTSLIRTGHTYAMKHRYYSKDCKSVFDTDMLLIHSYTYQIRTLEYPYLFLFFKTRIQGDMFGVLGICHEVNLSF